MQPCNIKHSFFSLLFFCILLQYFSVKNYIICLRCIPSRIALDHFMVYCISLSISIFISFESFDFFFIRANLHTNSTHKKKTTRQDEKEVYSFVDVCCCWVSYCKCVLCTYVRCVHLCILTVNDPSLCSYIKSLSDKDLFRS